MRHDAQGGVQRLVLGGQRTFRADQPDRALLRPVSGRRTEGGGLPAVEGGSDAALRRRSERPGLPPGSCSPGTDEPWWEETLSDGWNPQRLYARPIDLERSW